MFFHFLKGFLHQKSYDVDMLGFSVPSERGRIEQIMVNVCEDAKVNI